MLRNKEIKKLLLTFVIVLLIEAFVLFSYDQTTAILALCFTSILMVIFFFFTYRRYQNIRQLSDYLVAVYTGNQPLDIRDNVEGELSILKNDIYKVTHILKEQKEQLKQDKQYLEELLSNISHQLKTPLTSMFMMTDLLKDQKVPQDKQEEFLENIINQLKRMEWLVSSLLKLSRMDAGTITFQKNQVYVNDIVKKALEPLQIPMELKHQTVKITGAKSVAIIGDFEWTVEAFSNVLKNCMEHTAMDGTIWIKMKETPLHTEVIIEDNGNGVDPDDIPYLFDRFYKGKNATASSVGIGLALTKTILQSQNAEITVERKNRGTRFNITFYKQVV